jgi:hypothetical protein
MLNSLLWFQYTSLFAALARDNSVGGKFGFKGRWEIPPPAELTHAQQVAV